MTARSANDRKCCGVSQSCLPFELFPRSGTALRLRPPFSRSRQTRGVMLKSEARRNAGYGEELNGATIRSIPFDQWHPRTGKRGSGR